MIGTKLAHYEITSHIGSGGMGEVYQATDTKLGRSVAIKFLPEAFSDDSDRVARFEREARVLASLNHPHIAAIYGLEYANGTHFLVLELVEGETLADQLRRGPIPLDESLKIAEQIAEALQAAHEKGVIHRDLKPANIKITHDGVVKVLDFGLAKATGIESSEEEVLSNSPTLRTLASTPGMILGTAAYMSPEQAKGRPVDRRTDIFAFGCVLYEMLTGKRAFEGEDVSDTLASVLRAEPDWAALPNDLPVALRTLIQRCLTKDRGKRIADVSVARFLLAEPVFAETSPASISASPPPRWKSPLLIMTGVLLGIVLAGSLYLALRTSPPRPSIAQFSITLPEGQSFSSNARLNIAISPDGTQIVYAANSRLYRRSISDIEARAIAGTESKELVSDPAFSPDGGSIAYFSAADRSIMRVAANGGTPVSVCASVGTSGIDWSPEGIVFAHGGTGGDTGVFRVAPDGGTPERIVSIDSNGYVYGPQMLPGRQAILFSLAEGGENDDRWDKGKIVVQSISTGKRTTIVEGASNGRYLLTGHLSYTLAGNVLAVPFDLQTLSVGKSGVPIIQGIRRSTTVGVAQFAVSKSGTLAYIPGSTTFAGRARMFVITDRKSSTRSLPLPAGPYRYPRVSRDGKYAAVTFDDGREVYISIFDLATNGALRRITFDGHDRFPTWSGDSQWIAFQSDREGDLGIFMRRADGSSPRGERLTKPETGVAHIPESWSPDGRILLFSKRNGTAYSLWSLSLENKKVMPFDNVQSTDPINATFSPDGHWVAYAVNDRGGGTTSPNRGIYVEPFPATGARYQVPKEVNDFHPTWSPTTAELFYLPRATQFSAVSIQMTPNVRFGKAVSLPTLTLDRVSIDVRDYDVLPDGRFLSTVPAEDDTASRTAGAPQIRVVLNWLEELKQRVPVK